MLIGVPDWVRTSGHRLRRAVLYPAELRAHKVIVSKQSCETLHMRSHIIDHDLPWSWSGETVHQNLETLCHPSNLEAKAICSIHQIIGFSQITMMPENANSI